MLPKKVFGMYLFESTRDGEAIHAAINDRSWNRGRIIHDLKAAGADIEYRDFQKYTPLLKAAERCDTESVTVLLDCGANVHSVNREGKSALMLCMQPFSGGIYNNAYDIMNKLLEKGTNIMHIDKLNRTVLHYVAMNITNDKGIMSQILLEGGDVRIVDLLGMSAIDYARKGQQGQPLGKQTLLYSAGAKYLEKICVDSTCWKDIDNYIQKMEGTIPRFILEDQLNTSFTLANICRKQIRSYLLGNVADKMSITTRVTKFIKDKLEVMYHYFFSH